MRQLDCYIPGRVADPDHNDALVVEALAIFVCVRMNDLSSEQMLSFKDRKVGFVVVSGADHHSVEDLIELSVVVPVLDGEPPSARLLVVMIGHTFDQFVSQFDELLEVAPIGKHLNVLGL